MTNNTALEKSLNSPIAITTSTVMGIALIIMFLLLPLFVGAVAEHMVITDQQLSWLASMDIGGFCVAATAFAFFARKINWRWTAAGLLVAMIVLNFLSLAHKDDINAFLTMRFLNGLTQGGLVGIFAAHISDTLFPERNYGIFFAAQTIVAAILLFLLPSYIAEMASPAPILYAQSGLAVIALIMVVLSMPYRGKDRSLKTEKSKSFGFLLPLVGMVGLMTFYITQGGLWAFIERIGNSFSLEAEFVGVALSISMAGSFCGSLFATFIGLKWGKITPLVITLIGQLICLWWLFTYGHNNAPYLLSITLFSFLWSYVIPYIFGILIDVDPSGRAILFSKPIFALGVSLAPVILSFFISGGNYLSVGYLCAITLTFSIGLFLFLLKRIKV